MNKVGVIQLIDTLNAGGAERMAVNIANLLPQERYRSFLCATRSGGMLKEDIAPHVAFLQLNRRYRLDFGEMLRLVRFVREHKIALLHAHGTSLFVAVIVARFVPSVKVIWHDHHGLEISQRKAMSYRIMVQFICHVIVVNEALQHWVHNTLSIPYKQITYLPNFVSLPERLPSNAETLLGKTGARLLCLANLRLQKNHPNLLRAMQIVKNERPHVHLFLAGDLTDTAYVEQIRSQIEASGLQNHVSLLGTYKDVETLLQSVDIGVLSSASEGLPLALLEYGMAGLPVVTTDVGQCADVLDNGNAGILVPPQDSDALAVALIRLLASPELRQNYGAILQQRVRSLYSPEAGLHRLHTIYAQVMEKIG